MNGGDRAEPERILVGWREQVTLPRLGLRLRCKVDTGAKTSALHATDQETFDKDGQRWVRFVVHPLRRREDVEVQCEAPVLDERTVKNSGGFEEHRTVIRTVLRLGEIEWEVDLTLTDRRSMAYRMLLGRRAMAGHVRVDPGLSYVHGKTRKKPRKPQKQSGRSE